MTSVDVPGLTADGITDISSFTYAASGALSTATNPVGLVTTIQTVNKQRQPTQVLAADGVTWGFSYDLFGRLLTSTMFSGSAGAKTTTYAYDNIGQLVSMTNSLGKTWTFEYDGARRMTKATSPSGDVARYTYDTLGNVTRTEYGTASPTTTFYEDTQFDELGRLLKTLGAQGQIFTFSHDVEDNLSAVTDTLNYATTNGYDALNRPTQVVDREGYTTALARNDSDLLTQYTDPRLIPTQFTYNGFGEVITEVSADRGTIAYTYDRRGLVKTITDARGIVTNYNYNNAGQLTLIDYPSGVTPNIALAYGTTNGNNTAGKLSLVTQGSVLTNAVSYPFDTAVGTSRVVEALTYPASRNYAIDTTFYAEGNVKVITYPSGDQVDYTYDNDNRITQVRLKPSGSSTWDVLASAVTYRPNGPLATMTLGDGYLQTRTYDSSYRLTRLQDTKSGSPVLRDVSMGYSLVDNLTSITDAQTAANNETFGYTPREHLSTATGPFGALAYTYDGVDNRVTQVATPPSSASQTDSYTYPATKNRLTSVALGAGGSRVFTYDAAGNVTLDNRSGTNYAYAYDSAGRMVSFSIGAVLQAEYVYNHRGQQAVRKLYGASPATIHSVFGPDGNRIAEYDEASGALLREYVWLDGAPIAVREGGVNYFVRVDHIGRPVFATNAAGAKVWSLAYLPFGGVRAATGVPTALRFPGQWFQSETGLHQNWMRDYDPSTGRYLEADPLGLVDGASVYGYARQSPNMYADPTGECPWCALAAITTLFIVLDILQDDDGIITCTELAYYIASNLPQFKWARWAKQAGHAASGPWGGGSSGGGGPGAGGPGSGGRVGGGPGSGSGPGGGGGDYHPATPTGSRGHEMGVPPGTNSPDTISGRDYSGHALDRMQERGYTPSVVENAIGSGVPGPGNTPGTIKYVDATNNISVVVNGTGGVVTVRGGP